MVLETRRLESRCRPGRVPSCLFQLLWGGGWLHPLQHLPPSLHGLLPAPLCLHIRTRAIWGWGPVLQHWDLKCTNYICGDPVFKQGHAQRYWELELQHVFLGDTVQPIIPSYWHHICHSTNMRSVSLEDLTHTGTQQNSWAAQGPQV